MGELSQPTFLCHLKQYCAVWSRSKKQLKKELKWHGVKCGPKKVIFLMLLCKYGCILRSEEEIGGCFIIGDCRELAQSGCGFNNYQSHWVESRQGLCPAYLSIYKGSDELSGLGSNTAWNQSWTKYLQIFSFSCKQKNVFNFFYWFLVFT